MSDKKKYIYAVGRRKTAVVQIKLFRGGGVSMVNRKPADEYFPGKVANFYFRRPFDLTKLGDKYYGIFKVKGGGKESQLEAATSALSRALVKVDEKNRPVLKKAKLLTIDARARERRKAGQMGRARKKKQSPRR